MMIEVSERAKWPTIDIVRLVLEGHLSRIQLLPAELRFKSVLVDPDEVKRQLNASASVPFLYVLEAAAFLKLRARPSAG